MKGIHPEFVQCHLKPGELLICRDSRIVTTVLGSCVAVTMFNARVGLAAMCHAMLPGPRRGSTVHASDPERFRYLTCAIPAMTQAFLHAAVAPDEIIVKIFGGASVLHPPAAACSAARVGQENVDMARQLLRDANLRPKASNVGGHGGRKLIFNTATGSVLHKQLG